ncbi:MAG: hypothetical protein BYD32DRAFT_431670 [Podila humilis]|nr:MAG: hypothetical protein BYD32DRAFT_431670 [Podila humilis]
MVVGPFSSIPSPSLLSFYTGLSLLFFPCTLHSTVCCNCCPGCSITFPPPSLFSTTMSHHDTHTNSALSTLTHPLSLSMSSQCLSIYPPSSL